MSRAPIRVFRLLGQAARAGRALSRDRRATAAVEAALILPVALTMLALMIYGAEAFNVQRKVTLTARTVTDLVSQTAPMYVSSQPSIQQSTVVTDLSYASCVMAPYSPCLNPNSNLKMVVSEVQVNSDQTDAKVIWSQPYNSATPRTAGTTVTLPTGMGTGQAGAYYILGEVTYVYTPLNFYTPTSAMTLHDSIYLAPRGAASLALLVGQ